MNNDSLNNRINEFCVNLNSMTLEKIINQYDKIEDQVVNGIVQIVVAIFESENIQKKGSLIIIEGDTYQLFVDYSLFDREVRILLINQWQSKHKTTKEFSIQHNEFGRIKKTIVILPVKLSLLNESILSMIKRWVSEIYASLEVKIVNELSKLKALPLNNLYEILFAHGENRGYGPYVKNGWFSVSNLKELTFRYQLSHNQIIDLITRLKKGPLQKYSPFECLLAIVVNEVHDAVLDGNASYENGVFTVPFTSLGSISTDLCFWNAEKVMFQFPSLSAIDIAVFKNKYNLQLNVPTSDSQKVLELVRIIEPILIDQFFNNMVEYTNITNKLKKLSSPITQTLVYKTSVKWLGDIVSEIIIKTWDKFIKKG